MNNQISLFDTPEETSPVIPKQETPKVDEKPKDKPKIVQPPKVETIPNDQLTEKQKKLLPDRMKIGKFIRDWEAIEIPICNDPDAKRIIAFIHGSMGLMKSELYVYMNRLGYTDHLEVSEPKKYDVKGG
ncbi:hypothetical protein [Rhizosphaericola mali]|uniref:Uncharacterized protein n=1 Tax=Rhizosphaericola mali TaxID=2545455 RepID=A0A5P2FZ93_9BACT|nr:hypothetical protein [Rhizosphaericola mali]QES88846.1 hypothetical protein E0W69_009330 [Rhizosphaericola mali]